MLCRPLSGAQGWCVAAIQGLTPLAVFLTPLTGLTTNIPLAHKIWVMVRSRGEGGGPSRFDSAHHHVVQVHLRRLRAVADETQPRYPVELGAAGQVRDLEEHLAA